MNRKTVLTDGCHQGVSRYQAGEKGRRTHLGEKILTELIAEAHLHRVTRPLSSDYGQAEREFIVLESTVWFLRLGLF